MGCAWMSLKETVENIDIYDVIVNSWDIKFVKKAETLSINGC